MDKAINQKEALQQKKESQETEGNLPSMSPPEFNLEAPAVQQKSAGAASPASFQPVQKKESGNDSGMGEEVQSKMESSFGADFSNVNIHEDSDSATNMGALAYTQGNDVHFAPGQFKPDTQSGQELIGHELTHVVQQREGRVQPNTQVGGMPVNNDKGLETEADNKGKMAAQAKMGPQNTSAGSSAPSSGKDSSVQMKTEDDPLKVDHGQLTFDVEGQDNASSRYFSRVVHWPEGNSGVTIGRGFDLGARSKEANLAQLNQAGIVGAQATLLAEASGLKGKPAGDWVKANKDKVGTITHEQQKALFDIVYENHKQDVIRISSKKDVVENYGAANFDEMNPAIMDVLVDLRYRGDYHSKSRQFIQKAAAENDLQKFADLMADENKWVTEFHVPKRRFEARRDYIKAALSGNPTTLKTDVGGQEAKAPAAAVETKKEETGTPIGSGTVTATSLNVRSGAGPTFGKVGAALTKGQSVTIYENQAGWLRIGPGQWVSGKYIDVAAAKQQTAPASSGASASTSSPIIMGKGTVIPNGLNVRSGPGGSNPKVGSPLRQGEVVTVYEEVNNWFRIGQGKWVFGDYLALYSEAPQSGGQSNMSEDTSSSSKEPLMSTVEDNVSSSETANSSSQSTSSQSTTSSGGSTTAPAANTSTKKEDSGIVTVSSLNVRKGPGGEFDKNGPALTSGSKVDIFQEENGWYRIGPDMWVSAKYVRVGALIPDNAGGKPPWLSVAEGEIGVTEIAGSKHNPRVIEYHSTTGGFKDDETPWCASFVTWVLKSAGKSSTGSASALSYRSYGTKLDKPAYGAIAVFSHGGGKGHVGFVVGKQGDKILVLGGNQSNMVKVSAYDTGKVVAYVVPSDYEVPASAYTLLGMTDKLETEGYAQTR